MGGSGSGGWTPTPPQSSCATLAFRASLNSPQPAVLAQLTVGTILTVALAASPQQAVYALLNGAPAGSLTGPRITSLINCLQNGFRFEAEVMSIHGGNCAVDVRAV
jgi:hypothetical protein